jgi:autotransporter translocation and assembly factor TamB
MSGLKVQRPIACQLKVTGALTEPEISGSFSIPQATFSNMEVDGIVGNFQYFDSRMLLKDVRGSVYQGKVGAEGSVRLNDESYELDASGVGLDSSRLTDKDVKGPLDFSGHVSGKGETAVTRGTFSIRDGKAYGIPFLKMTGNFVRRGEVTELSNIAMETVGGTIYPEQLSKEVLERLNTFEKPHLIRKASRKKRKSG